MKKNNDFYITIIFAIIIILLFIFIFYAINSSNNKLNNNKNNINDTNINNNKSNNNSSSNNNNVDIYDNTSNKVPEKIETEIASFSSNLYDNDKNRVHNIALAIEKINNKIISSNETFSFNNTVGPMTEKNGFKKAIGFDSKGRNIKISGGGLCQLSSTIYNAALIANLEIIERHPHSKRVYYVPKDKDATIAYGSLDFKFKNNKENDIKIVASNTSSNVTIKLIEIKNG